MNTRNKIVVAGTKVALGTAPVVAGGDWKISAGTAISQMLTVALDAFVDISQKRTEELFDNRKDVEKIIDEVKKSDDFASLVFDLWKRYNYESSESRRRMLKAVLKRAVNEDSRDYDNFSKIFLIIQQITNTELIVLDAFYKPYAYNFAENPASDNEHNFQINVQQLHRLFTDKKLNEKVLPELSQALTQLGNYGLIAERPATLAGPFYAPLRFGKIFIEYIQS